MRVEYSDPSQSHHESPNDHAGQGGGTAGLDQEPLPPPEDERPAADSRTTVG